MANKYLDDDKLLYLLQLLATVLDKKVSKETGKSLLSDTEIERLAGLTNYNDTEVRELIAALQDGKVDKVTGKGLSTNDLTNELVAAWNEAAQKVDDLITEGGEPNVIETVKVNGTALTVTDKAVDVEVPTTTSDLTNDSNFVADASYVHTDNNYTTTEKTKLSSIAENAQVNIIETVKMNGTALNVTNKAVDVETDFEILGTINGSGDNPRSISFNKTFSEIKEAYDAKKTIFVRIAHESKISDFLYLNTIEDSLVRFQGFSRSTDVTIFISASINANNETGLVIVMFPDDMIDGIRSKQDALTQAQLNAVNSGVTSNTVTQVGTNTSDIADLKTAVGTGGSVDTKIENAINELDSSTTATSGSVLTGITIANGKITSKTEASVYTKSEIDTMVKGGVHAMGSVATYSALPASPALGDMYNIQAPDSTHGIKAGDNVVWIDSDGDGVGDVWDNYGGVVDTSGLLPIANAMTNDEVKATFDSVFTS